MTRKTLKESFNEFVESFASAGLTLSEEQKTAFAGFVDTIDAKLTEEKVSAAKSAAAKTAEVLESKYRRTVEKLIKNMTEHNILSQKITRHEAVEAEHKELAKKVDEYLDLYVEEALPARTIVDYKKMKQLEDVVESVKNVLVVNSADFEKRFDALSENFVVNETKLVEKAADLEKKLSKMISKNKALAEALDKAKAQCIVEKKCKDLPVRESAEIKKQFKGATTEEVKKHFDEVCEKSQKTVDDTSKTACTETTLEEEIKNIIGQPSSKTGDSEPAKSTPASQQDDDDSLHESVVSEWIKRCATITPIHG